MVGDLSSKASVDNTGSLAIGVDAKADGNSDANATAAITDAGITQVVINASKSGTATASVANLGTAADLSISAHAEASAYNTATLDGFPLGPWGVNANANATILDGIEQNATGFDATAKVENNGTLGVNAHAYAVAHNDANAVAKITSNGIDQVVNANFSHLTSTGSGSYSYVYGSAVASLLKRRSARGGKRNCGAAGAWRGRLCFRRRA